MKWQAHKLTEEGGSPSLLRRIMGKIFFIRKSREQLLIEQNTLLLQLLTAQPPPSTSSIQTPIVPPEESVAGSEEPTYTIDDEAPFIPKAAKAKSSVNTVETSSTHFDPEEVARLKKAKRDAAKKNEKG